MKTIKPDDSFGYFGLSEGIFPVVTKQYLRNKYIEDYYVVKKNDGSFVAYSSGGCACCRLPEAKEFDVHKAIRYNDLNVAQAVAKDFDSAEVCRVQIFIERV